MFYEVKDRWDKKVIVYKRHGIKSYVSIPLRWSRQESVRQSIKLIPSMEYRLFEHPAILAIWRKKAAIKYCVHRILIFEMYSMLQSNDCRAH